jgi:type IV pilus assembly protein PilF
VNKSELLTFIAVLGLTTLSGCISTTTGTAEREPSEDAAEFNYRLGVEYYQKGTYDLARDRLVHTVSLDPRMGKAHMLLGMTYEALENSRLANEAYDKAIKLEPRNFDVQNAYAVFQCKQKDFEKAKRHFGKAADHPENDAAEGTLTNAGLCMMQEPDFEAAEEFFRAALDRKANHGEALLQLCLLKFRQQDFLGSRAFLQRFMSANKTTPGVLFLAAEIEGKLGNDSGRSEYINQLLRDFPESPEARRALKTG